MGNFDLILTQRHILGSTKLNSPYKIIAADINGDNKVGNIDLILMKRLILGTDTTFISTKGDKRLWAFVDSSYAFPDTTNPFPYKDSISFTNLTSSKSNQTFIGVKLGDVDYSWNAGLARSVSTKPVELQYSVVNDKLLMINDKSSALNYQLLIPITANNFKQLLGLQYTLHFDNDKYEFVRIDNNKLGIDFNNTQANTTGNISMLWTDAKAAAKTLNDGTELFTLILRSKELGMRNWDAANNLQLTINNSITDVEAWDNDEQKHNIIISKLQTTNYNNSITKHQTPNNVLIYPNPSKGEVNIETKGCKELLITDYLGRSIKYYVFKSPSIGGVGEATNIKSSIINIKLNKGVYVVKAVYKDGEQVSKLVVE